VSGSEGHTGSGAGTASPPAEPEVPSARAASTAPGGTARPLPYRLIATDLDGTLLRSDGTVSQRSRDVLAAVTAAGAAHLVVTGRSVPWTRNILADLGYRGLAVCGQGAQLYDAGANRLLTSVTLDRKVAGLALDKIEAEVGPIAVAASQDGLAGDVLIGEGYVYNPELPVVHVRDRAEMWAQPINKLYIQHPDLDDDGIAEVAQRVAGDLVAVMVAGHNIVELVPLGLTKAKGLALAARRLGVTAAETIAFGDMPNDIPMLTWSGHGVAMANAHPELKAVAQEITLSNDADGIAHTLTPLFAPFRLT